MVQPPTAPLLQGHAVINGLRTHTVQPQAAGLRKFAETRDWLIIS